MSEVTVIENENRKQRKAIYVDVPVFQMFKEDAEKDGRKYTQFLEKLLNVNRGVEKSGKSVKKKK
jgi:hypothetical protein